MQLAYVFWHWPADGVPREVYEDVLRAFHDALGLEGSISYRLGRAPWDGPGQAWPSLPDRPPYEDWYPVADWTEIGTLNDRALTGERRRPHDAAAERSGAGAGAVYRRVHGRWIPADEVRFATWLRKPEGVPYPGFLTELVRAAPEAAIWQRQMVLGPAPEFALFSREPLELAWPATQTQPESVI